MLTKVDRAEIASMLLVMRSERARTTKRLDNLIKVLVKKKIITKEEVP